MTGPHTRFLDALARGPLVVDGAMGTQLYERGIFVNKSLEEACLSSPALVRQVHDEYVGVGADIIETHTFAANRMKLQRHSLGDRTEDINRIAVRLAREAAAGRAMVAGAIGPTGITPGVVADDTIRAIRATFAEQARYLAEEGVDLIMLETFRLLSEIRLALEAVREVSDLPVVAQCAFDGEERTGDGADPVQVVELLKSLGANVVGANCVEGPQVVFHVAEKMVGHGVPISAQPNAGYPRRQDGRMIYMATPEYFGVYARRFYKIGVALVGGCCGTGPEHVRRVAAAARMMGGSQSVVAGPVARSVPDEGLGVAPLPTASKSHLAEKVMRVYRQRVCGADRTPRGPDDFVVSVEVNPPAGLSPDKALTAARHLITGGVDVINIADGPRATVRMSNSALALLMQRDLRIETILHVCGRDRNLLGLQSDLLAAHVLGLHNLVIITGDPPKLGDYPHATAVFDLDSIGLLRLAAGLNRGVDPAGKVMNEGTRFFLSCGAEPAALDYEREIRRLELKKAAGAEMIMTQPVYDPDVLRRFLDDTRHLDLPVLVGLLPLGSYKNAEFLHNEVPGMRIPVEIRDRMRLVGQGPEARAEGVRIAQEALLAVAQDVVGAYIMPPLGRYETALDVLACLGYGTTAATTS